MNFCPECGSKIAGKAPKFCGKCGSALPIATDELTPETSQQYLDESKPLEGDVAGARDGGEQAAAAGNTDAMIKRGLLAHNEGDVAGARRWWEQAAAAGDPDAATELRRLAHVAKVAKKTVPIKPTVAKKTVAKSAVEPPKTDGLARSDSAAVSPVQASATPSGPRKARFCEQCGAARNSDARFCGECGRQFL